MEKTVMLNSNLLPIISVAMYNTILSPDEMFSDSEIDNDNADGHTDLTAETFWEKFDNKAYEKHIQGLAADYINGDYESNGLKVTIKAGDIYSPRYYNFENDNIDLEVTFDFEAMRTYGCENTTKFGQFLKEHYSSYDGFLSSTANNVDEWIQDYYAERAQEVAAVIRFWFENEGIQTHNTYEGEFDAYAVENTNNYTQFVKDEPEEKETAGV